MVICDMDVHKSINGLVQSRPQWKRGRLKWRNTYPEHPCNEPTPKVPVQKSTYPPGETPRIRAF